MGTEKSFKGLTGYQILINTFSKLEEKAKIKQIDDRHIGRQMIDTQINTQIDTQIDKRYEREKQL